MEHILKITDTNAIFKSIFISDDYISGNNKTENYVLKRLKKAERRPVIHTGILKLKQKKYIEFINECVCSLQIGMESTSDFTLSNVNKGYGYKEILEAVDCMIKNMNKNIIIYLNVILDLPFENQEDRLRNYENLLYIKEKLVKNGFFVQYLFYNITINPNTEIIDNSLIYIDNDISEELTNGGRAYLNYLQKVKKIKVSIPEIVMPKLSKRYYDSKKLIETDLYMLSDIKYDFIFQKLDINKLKEKRKKH